MTYAYLLSVQTSPIGHVATSTLRDAFEDAVSGSLDEGETMEASVEGDGKVNLLIRSERSMKEHELSSYAEAIKSVLSDCLGDGDEAIVGGFEIVEVPGPRP